MEDDIPPIDLEALDRYLDSELSPDDCMGLSELDGFLTAIVIGPQLIPPSEWLPVIWGDEEPAFESEDEMRTIIGTIMGRYNEIATCFDSNPDEFKPIFREGMEGEVMAADWAAGFLEAIALRRTAWEPLINHRRARILLAPLFLLSADPNLHEEDGDPVDWEKVANAAPRTVPICVVGIHDFWKDQRERSKPQPRRNRRPKR
jgi:uncharacterized protein